MQSVTREVEQTRALKSIADSLQVLAKVAKKSDSGMRSLIQYIDTSEDTFEVRFDFGHPSVAGEATIKRDQNGAQLVIDISNRTADELVTLLDDNAYLEISVMAPENGE